MERPKYLALRQYKCPAETSTGWVVEMVLRSSAKLLFAIGVKVRKFSAGKRVLRSTLLGA